MNPMFIMATAKGIEGINNYRNAKQQARDMKANAANLRLQGKDVRARGGMNSDIVRNQGKQLSGSQRVAMAANGVDIGSGTPSDILTQTASMTELDSRIVENNAMREAWGLDQEANQLDAQAKQVKKNARFGLVGSLLGMGASAGQGYSDWQKSKMPQSTSFAKMPNADFNGSAYSMYS